jgi:hypothetical protein
VADPLLALRSDGPELQAAAAMLAAALQREAAEAADADAAGGQADDGKNGGGGAGGAGGARGGGVGSGRRRPRVDDALLRSLGLDAGDELNRVVAQAADANALETWRRCQQAFDTTGRGLRGPALVALLARAGRAADVPRMGAGERAELTAFAGGLGMALKRCVHELSGPQLAASAGALGALGVRHDAVFAALAREAGGRMAAGRLDVADVCGLVGGMAAAGFLPEEGAHLCPPLHHAPSRWSRRGCSRRR